MPNFPIEVFYAYADADELLRVELEKHLSLLHRQGLITAWHHRHILAGTDWTEAIDTHLEQASIILLLVSSDFLASNYSYGIEIQRAIARHEAKQALVIPILLRPVDWQGAPFAHLQALPTNAKAITVWTNQDEAMTSVATSLRQAIEHPSSLSISTSASSSPRIWNLPYSRNPFFTDREEILELLHDNYTEKRNTMLPRQVQGVSGLEGIGKTQVAIEYAYRYHHEHEFTLWVRAATPETLVADFLTLANLLQLPERNEQNQWTVVEAVKLWLLTHTRWLLILDDIDDLELVHTFLPSRGSGHILLTTHMQIMGGIAKRIEVVHMTPEEGALFLLRRANIIEPEASLDRVSEDDRTAARAISELLGGLPLALDQAGAYIEETASSLSDYILLYNTRRTALLGERGSTAFDHPESVTTTWSLSFEKLKTVNPATVELLRFLAFLHPDAIPEEIITSGAAELGAILEPVASDPFSLNAVIRELLRYSLIRRNPGVKTLSMHHLLQVILKDEMDEATQRRWAERVVRAVSSAFPHVEFATWERCQRSLAHVQACAVLISTWKFAFPEAAKLLHHTGYYLYERGEYTDAELFFQKALTLQEQVLEPQHPHIATTLHDLALIYRIQGKYAQAEPMYLRAIELQKQVLGANHESVATSLNDLACLYRAQGKFEEAGQFYQQALALREQVLGPEHPRVAESLGDFALLYSDQAKYNQAESMLQRALAIREQALGPQHPYVAMNLNDLASLYHKQKKYAQAEPLYLRALATREQILGSEHPVRRIVGSYRAYRDSVPELMESSVHTSLTPTLERGGRP